MFSFIHSVVLPVVVILAFWKLSGRLLTPLVASVVIVIFFTLWYLGFGIFDFWGLANLSAEGVVAAIALVAAFMIARWLQRRYPRTGCGCLVMVAAAAVLLAFALSGALHPEWRSYRSWLS